MSVSQSLVQGARESLMANPHPGEE